MVTLYVICLVFGVTISLVQLNGIACENVDAAAELKEISQYPHFTQPDQLHRVVVKPPGQMLNIRCAGAGRPEPSITWTKDSNVIDRADEVKTRKWTLLMKNLSTDDTGHYECKLCNIHGCISHTTHLIVEQNKIFSNKRSNESNKPRDKIEPPRFTQPNQLNNEIRRSSGHMVNIRCSADGDPEPNITWTKDSAAINRIGGVKTRGWTLVMKKLSPRDNGNYKCELCNIYGCIGHTTKLHVEVVTSTLIDDDCSHGTSLWLTISLTILVTSIGSAFSLRQKFRMWLVGSRHVSNWEIRRDRLTIKEPLGKGNFGIIFKATTHAPLGEQTLNALRRNETTLLCVVFLARIVDLTKRIWPTEVAIKTLKKNPKSFHVASFLREIDIMKRIGKHDNIVNFLGCCTQDNGPIYAIIEYAPRGDLQAYLRRNGVNLSINLLISFAKQVARGMEYLESLYCVHRDLAARNVLVFDDNIVKISDFGLARGLQGSANVIEEIPLKESVPHRWRAPETLLINLITHDSSTDVWSYGVLLWEIIMLGMIPFPKFNNLPKLYEHLRNGHRLRKARHCPQEVYELMEQCWQWHPRDRPTFQEICNTLDTIAV